MLQGRALQCAAGQPAIIVGGLDQPPALATLAADERLTRFALRMQGVEVPFHPFLGGFAGVNGPAPLYGLAAHPFSPKKRGPDQRDRDLRRRSSGRRLSRRDSVKPAALGLLRDDLETEPFLQSAGDQAAHRVPLPPMAAAIPSI